MTDYSYQLYSSRNHGPLGDTLAMLKRLGYAGVEGYGALYADDAHVRELKRHLDATGLAMRTAHFALDMLEREPRRALDIAATLGVRRVYCPYVLPEHRPTDGRGWEAFGRRLAEAGKPVRDAGLGFGWHNHDFEFVKTADGAIPQVALFEAAPDLEWEADLAWVVKGGADPFHWVEAFRDRITAVHVKDIARPGENVDEDGWADVGHGTVDWRGLMKALAGARVEAFILEHDKPSDDARFAERSLAAVRAL